ncbi:glycosyltransferase family 2 protein [Pantanalinema sp. GBBB05]|uniref:glycosyltransferase family 2 protein n=1 Tax=Pantanalinema sp. GBBB05 TaxID=2604139 RepID=UPI003D816364
MSDRQHLNRCKPYMTLDAGANVYLIIPVHNRKATTLACLNHLQHQGDLQRYQTVVVDDGSTDGTQAAIQALHPSVTVLTGDGNLWWTGAIALGMNYAIEQGADYLIWLNDDCYPQPGAIAKLVTACRSQPNLIAGGQSLDPETGQPSYGGIICANYHVTHVHTANDSDLECDGLAGNFVCIPKSVVDRIGYPDPRRCPHYYEDVVYTHQAKSQGYQLRILHRAIAQCKDDHPPISWMMMQKSPLAVWKERLQIKSPHYWKAHLAYYWEFMGFMGIWLYIYQLVLKFSIISILVILLPLQYRMKLKQLIARKT